MKNRDICPVAPLGLGILLVISLFLATAHSVSETSSTCPVGKIVHLVAESSPKYIVSPNQTEGKNSLSDCDWVIKAADRSCMVRITVLFSRLSGCNHEWFKVFDGITVHKSLGHWCGNLTPTYRSTYSYLRLQFHSDGVGVSEYRIQYQQTGELEPIRKHETYTLGALAAIMVGIGVVIAVGLILYAFYQSGPQDEPPETTRVDQSTGSFTPLSSVTSDFEESLPDFGSHTHLTPPGTRNRVQSLRDLVLATRGRDLIDEVVGFEIASPSSLRDSVASFTGTRSLTASGQWKGQDQSDGGSRQGIWLPNHQDLLQGNLWRHLDGMSELMPNTIDCHRQCLSV